MDLRHGRGRAGKVSPRGGVAGIGVAVVRWDGGLFEELITKPREQDPLAGGRVGFVGASVEGVVAIGPDVAVGGGDCAEPVVYVPAVLPDVGLATQASCDGADEPACPIIGVARAAVIE